MDVCVIINPQMESSMIQNPCLQGAGLGRFQVPFSKVVECNDASPPGCATFKRIGTWKGWESCPFGGNAGYLLIAFRRWEENNR